MFLALSLSLSHNGKRESAIPSEWVYERSVWFVRTLVCTHFNMPKAQCPVICFGFFSCFFFCLQSTAPAAMGNHKIPVWNWQFSPQRPHWQPLCQCHWNKRHQQQGCYYNDTQTKHTLVEFKQRNQEGRSKTKKMDVMAVATAVKWQTKAGINILFTFLTNCLEGVLFIWRK